MTEQEKKEGGIEVPNYTDKEKAYHQARIQEMVIARNIREQTWDFFDGMTYSMRCEANRKLANTYIQPKKNKEDTNYMSGTVRQKINFYLSSLNNLELAPEVRAFNDREVEDVSMGSALTDVVTKTSIMDEDEEKRLNRQYVLLEQGEVFVEEVWPEYYETVKKLDKPFDGTNFDLKITSREVKKSAGPTRNILVNENVYLGDITVFEMDNQPFIFTVQQIDYGEAEQMYGTWARWKNVPRTVKPLDQPMPNTSYSQAWSITQVQQNQVEIVKYQNKVRNEYAIWINGVLMTPVGLPIPRKWGKDGESVKYNVVKQTLFVMSPFFAYGKGIPHLLKTKAYILDEMNRLAVLKTQQSFQPPRWNTSGIVLSSRVFMPGKVNNGLDGTKIGTIGDASGMTRSELQMIQYLQKGIDDDAVSHAIPQGQGIGSRTSATQVQQMKAQADLMIALTIFAATTLEMKLGNLRLYNVLENFFDPIDQVLNDAKDKLLNKYRSINVDKMIPGKGPGQSIVKVSDEPTTQESVQKEASLIETKTGKPTEITVLNPDLVKTIAYSYYVAVVPKPKKNSDLTRVLFNEMLSNAKVNFPNLNLDYMSERYAVIWGEDPTKMFSKQQGDPNAQPDPNAPTGQNGARGRMVNKQMMKAGGPKPPKIGAVTK